MTSSRLVLVLVGSSPTRRRVVGNTAHFLPSNVRSFSSYETGAKY